MRKNDLLLVTDMQNVYRKGEKWECLHTEEAALNIQKLLPHFDHDHVIFTAFRASDHPHGAWADYNRKYADVNASAYLNDIVPELKEASTQYPFYTKSVYSSVHIPAVREAALKADRVVVTGVIAECCVLFTVFDLIDLGCHVVYLLDAVSGLDETKEKAAVSTLVGLSPLHVQLMNTEQYLQEES
jgi:nicotinamidase-related amidase